MANATGTESVKIDAKLVQRIRKYVGRNGMTISGYIKKKMDVALSSDEEFEKSNKSSKK